MSVLKETFYKTATRAMNAALQTDADSMQRLQNLAGHTVVIEVSDLNWRSKICFHPDKLEWCADDEEFEGKHADVILSAKYKAFFGLMRAGGKTDALFKHRVHIQGDAGLAEQFQVFLRELDVDYEALLSPFIGQVAATRLRQAGQSIMRGGREAGAQFAEQWVEYLQAECAMLPTQEKFFQWKTEVTSMRDRVERLQARIAALQIKIDNK